jgi:hypothetical protein
MQPAAIPIDQPTKQPTYRDQQLHKLMKDLRASVRSNPNTKLSPERVEQRLCIVLRVIELWDASHAERARELLRFGKIGAANTAATMIFDPATRLNLLSQPFIGLDHEADARIAEAAELGREVLC